MFGEFSMFTAIHVLQKRVQTVENDEYGRPLVNPIEEWQTVCRCRCDYNESAVVPTDNGGVIRPQYRIITSTNNPDVKPNDYIRCLTDNKTIKGEGRVKSIKTLNYLPYAEIFL